MKKFSIVIVLLLALTLALSACSSTETTDAIARWSYLNGESETQVFNISKANFGETATTYTVNGTSTSFVKYPLGRYEYTNIEHDELTPTDIDGTYTTVLTSDGDTLTYTADRRLYLKYSVADIANLNIDITSDQWKAFVLFNGTTANDDLTIWNATDGETAESVRAACSLTAENGSVIFYTRQISSVTFQSDVSQRPLSSTTKRDGFYIGKTAQEVTHVEISAAYDWNAKKVTVNNADKTSEATLSTSKTLIDANQMLLYTRSLEKASTKFQDSPSVLVFSPADNAQYTASFDYFAYSYNTLATTADGNIPVKLNLVGISVDSMPLLVQLNVPDTVAADSYSTSSGGTYRKFTTTSFRSGYYFYELAEYDAEILKGITVATDAAESDE